MRGRVLVADDHPLVRDAICAAVRSNWPTCQIDGAESLAEAESLARAKDHYGLVVLDLMLPDASGLSGLLLLQRLLPSAKIVIVSAREDASAVSTAFALGASAYVTKATPITKIAETLRRAVGGERIFPTAAALASPMQTAAKRLQSLSAAQMRILLALADGRLNKQIAADMSLTEATVKAHLTAIFRKLSVSNRTQAILLAKPLLATDQPSPGPG